MKSDNPYMTSLALIRKGISDCGFEENFTVSGRDFRAIQSNRIYTSADVKVISTMRFSGTDAQKDHAEIYLLETRDGLKGIFER